MSHHYTRDELRADILELTTTAIQENNRALTHLINECLADALGQLAAKIDQTNDKIDFTHKLLHVHVANPSAHANRHK